MVCMQLFFRKYIIHTLTHIAPCDSILICWLKCSENMAKAYLAYPFIMKYVLLPCCPRVSRPAIWPGS